MAEPVCKCEHDEIDRHGGEVAVQSIEPEEVLARVNRISTPYTIVFEAPLSWFAIWKGERSSQDNQQFDAFAD